MFFRNRKKQNPERDALVDEIHSICLCGNPFDEKNKLVEMYSKLQAICEQEGVEVTKYLYGTVLGDCQNALGVVNLKFTDLSTFDGTLSYEDLDREDSLDGWAKDLQLTEEVATVQVSS